MTNASPELSIVRGACGHDCPDTCSWIVTVSKGRAEKLQGNPDHPFTRGTLCAKVNHYLERVYHEQRVLHPLKRVGPKGQGRFERVTWEEALEDIAGRWKAIIAKSGAEAILPYSSAGTQGLIQMASLDRRLFGLLGCTNLERNICGEVAGTGIASTQGVGYGADPEDIVHSRYIVLWGTNTIVTNLHLWPIISEARERGAKIVVVDPIRTRTAEQADWHLAVRPGSDAALALAMMHVIIRDNLVDHDYVSRYATGYAELVQRVQEYSPAAVADVVGLDALTIEQFAREYATTQPALLRPLIGIEHHRNGAMMFRTIACLPILIGAWRVRGGGLSRSTHGLQFSTLNTDGLWLPQHNQKNVRSLNMRDLGNDLCNPLLTPPVRSLCVYNCNPAVTIPNQPQVLRGLQREDLFTVVHDLFITDTAKYADYVLPATSQIEHLDLVPAWGHHYLALNRPAIEPVGEAVANTEFFRRLARALGRTELWLYDSDEQLIRTVLDSSHPWIAPITYERLWAEGFVRFNPERNWLPFAEGGFPTKSGKAELYSQTLLDHGLDPLPSSGDMRQGSAGKLQLITGKTLHFLNSGYSHMARHCHREGRLFIEINARDAESRNLVEGALVQVYNEQGQVSAECRISPRVRPGIVWMPFGGLQDATGKFGSVNVLTPEEPTDWGGGSGFYDTFVDVRLSNTL
ncbi:MAG: molybdopterin-dependent oxidoreductase [Planctomycetaceae bacterium]|nr:molybdopterin-dependent oxidoreductase [Planctomycetaceae bacterium]